MESITPIGHNSTGKLPMITVYHRFLDEKPHPETETLILGTFNPDTPANTASYFYSRRQNHFWKLLPVALGENIDLRFVSREEKKTFCRVHKIGFADLIASVCVPLGSENNYSDDFIDAYIYQWNDIDTIINDLPLLKRVYFTRKTFTSIPHIRRRMESFAQFCIQRGLLLFLLPTPARIYDKKKQSEWNQAFRK